jgi:hypothetical protein
MAITNPVLEEETLSAPAAVIEEIVNTVCNSLCESDSSFLERYDATGRYIEEDILHHLRQLDTAFRMQNEEFFLTYALWMNKLLTRRGVKTTDLTDSFLRLDAALQGRWTASEEESFHRMLQRAVQALQSHR